MIFSVLLLLFALDFDAGFCFETIESDTLLKLVIFPPSAKVFDRPGGENIGTIGRGRVIRLLGSEGKWLNFTTYDFPDAWLRWEYTQTLEEWAECKPFDEMQAIILSWEKAVRAVDDEVQASLLKINEVKERISRGEIALEAGIRAIENERSNIEESFRALYQCETPDMLSAAAEKLDGKRWAINKGLYYLIKYIREGVEADGISATRYFQMTEGIMKQYSRIMFRIKTKYNLYEDSTAVSDED